MALSHISAPDRERTDAALSADNVSFDRFALMKLVRQAAPTLGLKPPVLATLEVLLSFLPPRRSHHMVFASNQTLVERRNGICERSLRRHFCALEAAGLLTRQDSPNGKRFSRRNPQTGLALRFGFDLTPLFQRATELAALAQAEQHRTEEQHYLRLKLRSLLARLAGATVGHEAYEHAQKLLRRRCDLAQLEAVIEDLSSLATSAQELPADPVQQEKTSATDGQNVRHHQKSNIDNIDRNVEAKEQTIDLAPLLHACPEALEFAVSPIRSEQDALHHAQTLAPMLGITNANYDRAKRWVGVRKAALTVWILLSMQGKIRDFAAYFHAVTLGPKQASFDPWAILQNRLKIKAAA